MLYLYTGVPGAGKTLHMVSQLYKEPEFKERPLYVDGITDLDPEAIPHNALPEGCSGLNWHEWLPEGSILIIDECQRYWRPRPNGSAVPPAIQALETHRHKGIDIYFLTQDPKKIDSQIRNLIEVHKHFSMSNLGIRRCFEWRNKVGDPNSRNDVKSAIVTPYFLDESVYGFYTSSVLHNTVKAKKSKWIYGLPFMLLLALFFMGFGLYKLKNIMTNEPTHPTNTANPASATAQSPSLPTVDNYSQNIGQQFNLNQTSTASSPHEASNTLTPQDYKARINGQPWTAPAYDAHNGRSNIQTMPYPVVCVKQDHRCTCYTDQATPIHNMDKQLCIDFALNGIYNPFKQIEMESQQMTPTHDFNSSNATDFTAPDIAQMGGTVRPSLRAGDSAAVADIQ